MVSRLNTFWQRHKRRLIALVAFVSVLSSVIPMPVSLRSPEKDSSQPFPCQNRPCGCRSAEQCWKKCCCFTNSQKVAWAKSHGVHPPQFVVAAADREQQASQCNSKTCCSKCSTTLITASEREVEPTPQAVSPESKNGDSHATDREKHDHVSLVIGVFAQECQGQGWGWHSLPWSVLPQGPTRLIMVQSRPERCPPISDSCPKRTLKPPVPPRAIVNSCG
jgi:hypothetical protein